MAKVPLTAHEPAHLAITEVAAKAQLPWPQILAWLQKYGFSFVIQVFNLVLPLLSGKKVDTSKLMEWIEQALTALAAGQPVPALPTL